MTIGLAGRHRLVSWRAMAGAALLAVVLAGCEGFRQHADEKFGDQHFKTAIALIELHRVRFGEYPDSLGDLKFLGDWDRIALQSVAYERAGDGYRLDVTRGWMGKPKLEYPPEFSKGLGIRPPEAAPGGQGRP